MKQGDVDNGPEYDTSGVEPKRVRNGFKQTNRMRKETQVEKRDNYVHPIN
jgi:hypothetical protein